MSQLVIVALRFEDGHPTGSQIRPIKAVLSILHSWFHGSESLKDRFHESYAQITDLPWASMIGSIRFVLLTGFSIWFSSAVHGVLIPGRGFGMIGSRNIHVWWATVSPGQWWSIMVIDDRLCFMIIKGWSMLVMIADDPLQSMMVSYDSWNNGCHILVLWVDCQWKLGHCGKTLVNDPLSWNDHIQVRQTSWKIGRINFGEVTIEISTCCIWHPMVEECWGCKPGPLLHWRVARLAVGETP